MVGCFRCRGCQRLGVCSPCFVAEHQWLPRLAVEMRCAHHRTDASDLLSSSAPSEGTPEIVGDQFNAHPHDETPVAGRVAARNWVALMERAEALFADVSADQTTTPSKRPDLWRTVKAAFDSVYLYEHQLAPHNRRLARELAWRRAHPDRLLPPYAPADAGRTGAIVEYHSDPYMAREALLPPDRWRVAQTLDAAYTTVFRRDWELCQCRACQLERMGHPQPTLPSGGASTEVAACV